ncbi:diacylglycerol/polyprenol kinase family protein [Rhodocaloribacter sp.]
MSKTAESPEPDGEVPEEISFTHEVRRKMLHLLALAVPASMAMVGKPVLFVLAPLALLALTADILRVRAAWFRRFIERFFGAMMRRGERPPLGGPVSVNGATWVLVSATLLTLIFPVGIAAPALATFMVADAAAALVGRRWGRRRWPGGPRTVEGTLAFLAAGLLATTLIPDLPFGVGAAGVTAAAAVEALPGPLNDNLRVPLVLAAVIFALERFALGMDVPLLAW